MAAGYSGTPQARKLGLAPRQRVHLDEAPSGWMLSDPPADLVLMAEAGTADVVIAFFRGAEELRRRLPGLASGIDGPRCLWVCWPRRAGGHTSDLTDVVVRDAALALGLVDVKVAAVDEDWSGLRFRRRQSGEQG